MPQNKMASTEALGAVRDWANGKFATASELSAKYSKPSGGIPETDLASAVGTKLNNMEFIVGTQTAKTGAWTGVSSSITALYDGLSILYYLPYAGDGNATLNLTLPDGTTTGAVNCYYSATSRLTTHYAAGSTIRLTYLSASNNKAGVNGWFATPQYYSTDNYNERLYAYVKAKTAITAKHLAASNDNTGYFDVSTGSVFDVRYPIIILENNLAAGSRSTAGFKSYISVDATVTQSGMSLTLYKPIYMKGVLDGTKFTVDSSAILTQTEPTSEDGKHYMLIGWGRSSTVMYLQSEHPIYEYKDGAMVEVGSADLTGVEMESNKVSSVSSSSTNKQYPTAKCLYDLIGDVETLLASI